MAAADIRSVRGESFSIVGLVTRGRTSVEGETSAAAPAGSTSLPLLDTTSFSATGGTVLVAGQKVNYSGKSGAALTGIAASGVGALVEDVPANVLVEALAAIDIRSATALAFTARRKRGGAAVVSKTLGSGVTVPGASPGNTYSIAIASSDTDAFTRAELLDYELRLTEAGGGDETVIAYGTWAVELGASP